MAETPASPDLEPATSDGALDAGPSDLEAVLAAALDEDDLPDPHPSEPTPILEAAMARPVSPPPPPAATTATKDDGGVPTVAATLEVAPLPAGKAGAADGAEGGEWDLLLGKVKTWLDEADLPGQWERLGGPLRGLGLLLAALLVLKLYAALLDTLGDIPLLPRLLQLAGLIALINFSLSRLTRKSDREVILADWKRRWDAFRGS